MNCEKYENMISLYADKLLDSKELLELKQHIEGCTSCRQQLEAIEFMQGLHVENEAEVKSSRKLKLKIYDKIYRDLLIMFLGLVIIIFVVSISGGLAQLFILDMLPIYAKIVFFTGIAFIILGLIILVYDILVDIIKIIFNK